MSKLEGKKEVRELTKEMDKLMCNLSQRKIEEFIKKVHHELPKNSPAIMQLLSDLKDKLQDDEDTNDEFRSSINQLSKEISKI